jgi:hypothetical protein
VCFAELARLGNAKTVQELRASVTGLEAQVSTDDYLEMTCSIAGPSVKQHYSSHLVNSKLTHYSMICCHHLVEVATAAIFSYTKGIIVLVQGLIAMCLREHVL